MTDWINLPPVGSKKKGLDVHSLVRQRAKAPNGKHFDELTDDDIDAILEGPEPKNDSRYGSLY